MVDDGGPAFPISGDKNAAWVSPEKVQDMNASANIIATGISVRDWFAGRALTGQLASMGDAASVEAWYKLAPLGSMTPFEWCAISAYKFADAMLEQRKK